MDRDLDGKMNFSEYLLIRMGIVAWKECAQGGMNRPGLRCALSLTLKERDVSQAEANTMFNTGLTLQHFNKTSLNFQVFVLLADFARVFSILEAPE